MFDLTNVDFESDHFKEVEERFNQYIKDAGDPAVGSNRWNYLVRSYYYLEGAKDGLQHARKILKED